MTAAGRAARLYVDRTWAAARPGAQVAADRFAGVNAFATIQSAIDAAPPGGTVNVAPGSYVEQLLISGKDLTLVGAGAGQTSIVSPAVLPISFVVGTFTNKAVVLCRNASNIHVRDLTVDGAGQGGINERFIGIAFFNAGGSVLNVAVTGVRDTPLDNDQHGSGIYSQNTTGGPYALEIGNTDINDFQKNGLSLGGTGLVADVHDCTVTGSGEISVIAQNGMQLGFGASGSIRDCTVSNLRYVPAIAVSGAVLVYQPGGPVSLSGFTGVHAFSNCQAPIRWYDGNGSIDGVQVTGPIVQNQDFGPISISNFTGPAGSQLKSRSLVEPDVPPASPLWESFVAPSRNLAPTAVQAALSVTVSHACIDGTDVVGTTGVYAFSSGSPLVVNVTNSLLHNWEFGIRTTGAATHVNVSNSSIASNATAGFDNHSSGGAVSAESNWWGDISGPSGTGPGSGDAIIGTGVDFTPWLFSGVNAEPGCGFSASPEIVNVVSPGGCLSTLSPCLTVDVVINRTTSMDVRAFSVPLQLSPNLELCAGPSSITEGSYLAAVGTTLFHVTDQGNGSYVVDGALLGLPCGASAPAGTLFSLAVARVPGPDGTGTVTLGSPILRDCDNGTVIVAAGPPASITIDATGPDPIGDVVATQVKSGNDVDGTTKIQLSFTTPGDAVSLEVYRAGFGNYPEYDDAPGSGATPAPPAYPPPPPWVLTGITASGQTDEVTQRDFWYFVAFSKDACGNVSTVSNETNGTLNYHLGDVSNGLVVGVGNNAVLVEDISLLGNQYPALLGANDPFGYLDVGPTSDGSVDGLPMTDNRVDFEDLIIFALNYGEVAAPLAAHQTVVSDRDALSLEVPTLPGPGQTFDAAVHLAGRGDIHGLSVSLAYAAGVVEPLGVAAGELLSRQPRQAIVLPTGSAAFDLAMLGPGPGISGTGEVAHVTFRVLAAGDPGIVLDRTIARDGANAPVQFGQAAGVEPSPGPPAITALGPVVPNPSRSNVRFEFSLARPDRVHLSVFDLSGRRIRTLIDGEHAAGTQQVTWNGRNDGGSPVAAGFYVLKLETGGRLFTRRFMIVR